MCYKAIGHNVLIGAVSSVVALNLGLSMGILSGRDGFLGMVSAGVIAIITSYFGGAKVGGSGPTAPMSALAAVILAKAGQSLGASGLTADQFLNLVLIMAAMFLITMSFFKLGRFISIIPGLIVSGFMSGIGLMIWVLQYKTLFGVEREALTGPMATNIVIALATFAIALFFPIFLKKTSPKIAPLIPGTLVALLVMTVLTHMLSLPIEFLELTSGEGQWSEWMAQLPSHWPHDLTVGQLTTALPLAVELALLCYLDTMLTLVVIEKMRNDKADRNKELRAQGIAMGAISLIGGVPGAQSTVPSVLLVKEGANSRWAGVSMGVFALLGVFMFAQFINYIPFAVIVGILLKVGWNVFDFAPVKALFSKDNRLAWFSFSFVVLTAVLAVSVDILVAVFVCTSLYHGLNKTVYRQKPIQDFLG